MKFIKLLFLAVLLFLNSGIKGQEVDKIKVPDLERILSNNEDRLHVVNFWATWCAPCVKEFPLFEKVSSSGNYKKVTFLMISLDFPGQIEKQLIPFLKKNKTTLPVALMMDVDYDSWIDKVDPSWHGDIPATLVFNNARKIRQFHSGELDEAGLRKIIDASIN